MISCSHWGMFPTASGFFANLSEGQQQAALAYRGEESIGSYDSIYLHSVYHPLNFGLYLS